MKRLTMLFIAASAAVTFAQLDGTETEFSRGSKKAAAK